MKKPLVIALSVATLSTAAVLWFSGLLVRIGGSNPLVRRARASIGSLTQRVPLEAYGLTARTTSNANCYDKKGVHCSNASITWSLCGVDGPTATWARTRRTDTCDPHDEEEGVDQWDQEPVVKTTIAGFDGYIVTWSPVGYRNRGDGCSFRGYRFDEPEGWTVLHIEGSYGCDEKLLAMMLSTEATGAPLRLTHARN